MFASFFSEMIIPGILWVRTKNSEQLMWEKKHLEEKYIKFNYTFFICVIFWDQKKLTVPVEEQHIWK